MPPKILVKGQQQQSSLRRHGRHVLDVSVTPTSQPYRPAKMLTREKRSKMERRGGKR